jgi:hypothetical protein
MGFHNPWNRPSFDSYWTLMSNILLRGRQFVRSFAQNRDRVGRTCAKKETLRRQGFRDTAMWNVSILTVRRLRRHVRRRMPFRGLPNPAWCRQSDRLCEPHGSRHEARAIPAIRPRLRGGGQSPGGDGHNRRGFRLAGRKPLQGVFRRIRGRRRASPSGYETQSAHGSRSCPSVGWRGVGPGPLSGGRRWRHCAD